jgi:hypothetical protein
MAAGADRAYARGVTGDIVRFIQWLCSEVRIAQRNQQAARQDFHITFRKGIRSPLLDGSGRGPLKTPFQRSRFMRLVMHLAGI